MEEAWVPAGIWRGSNRERLGVNFKMVMEGTGLRIVREDQTHEPVDDLRKFVIEFLGQKPGEESRALEQALHVRVLAGAGEHGGQGRMLLGELGGQVAQIGQFTLVVAVDHGLLIHADLAVRVDDGFEHHGHLTRFGLDPGLELEGHLKHVLALGNVGDDHALQARLILAHHIRDGPLDIRNGVLAEGWSPGW